jgi:hypothetical protein
MKHSYTFYLKRRVLFKIEEFKAFETKQTRENIKVFRSDNGGKLK